MYTKLKIQFCTYTQGIHTAIVFSHVHHVSIVLQLDQSHPLDQLKVFVTIFRSQHWDQLIPHLEEFYVSIFCINHFVILTFLIKYQYFYISYKSNHYQRTKVLLFLFLYNQLLYWLDSAQRNSRYHYYQYFNY